MRIVLQRISSAEVTVAGRVVGSSARGLLLLVGFAPEDGRAEIDYWARRVPELRIFEDEQGKMNLSVLDVEGTILAVPNFTLLAEVSKGRRPSFTRAAPPAPAAALFDQFVTALRARGVEVQTGEFGAHMHVALVNDGPVTLVLDEAAIAQFREGPDERRLRRESGPSAAAGDGPDSLRSSRPLLGATDP
jgi:D-tyrosyl-tRNA(Tyr) deacylase